MPRSDRWLSNKRIEVKPLTRANGAPLTSRIVAQRGNRLLAFLPSEAGVPVWLPPGARVLVEVAEVRPAGGPAQTDGRPTFEAQVVERRLRPFPLLILEMLTDVPVAAIAWHRTPRIVGIAGTRRGMGKSFFAANLSWALHDCGLRVALADLDLVAANTAACLDVSPPRDLAHLASGQARLEDLLVPLADGPTVLPGARGGLASPTPWQLGRMVNALAPLEQAHDLVVVDAGAGLFRAVTSFLLVADVVIVLTVDDSPAILDAYALTKAVTARLGPPPVLLALNRVRAPLRAHLSARRFTATVATFLSRAVELAGTVREDPAVAASIGARRPLVRTDPASPAAQDVRHIAKGLAERLQRLAVPGEGNGRSQGSPELTHPGEVDRG